MWLYEQLPRRAADGRKITVANIDELQKLGANNYKITVSTA
jgi:hypothetical protein